MKFRIRNALSIFLMFIMAGGISFAFNIALGGKAPIIHSFVCAMCVVIIYDLFAFMAIETKSEYKAPAKVFLGAVFAFCVFAVMGCSMAAFVKNTPFFWWMYVTWILFAAFAAWKSYRDAEKS